MMHNQIQLSPDSNEGGLSGQNLGMSAKVVTRENLALKPEEMTAVIPSNTLRFVVPIPPMIGRPFRQPEHLPTGDLNPTAGQQLLDYKGNPIAGEGVVFFNFKDNCWQALRTDGQGILIFNGVNEETAQGLNGILRSIVDHPSELTADSLQRFLDVAAANGYGDRYNSDAQYAAGNLVRAEAQAARDDFEGTANYGVFTRTKDLCHAVFLAGSEVAYQDGTASPQKSEGRGLVVVVTKDNKTRAVQPDAFEQSYRLANGDGIHDAAAQLKVQRPMLQ